MPNNKSKRISKLITTLTKLTGSQEGVVLSFLSVILGLALAILFKFNDLYMLIFNLLLSIITYILLFVLSASSAKDSKALSTRLDYIIHTSKVPDKLIELEKLEEEQIDAIRAELRRLKDED